jgi:peptide/nickel transport system ATP-binding protein
MIQPAALLQVKGLSVDFSNGGATHRAVQDVSFDLLSGKTLGIVGESGSGKSVTSLSVMRLIATPPGKISAGEILFNSKGTSTDLLKLTEREMQHYRGNKIGMVFQEPMTSLNPVYTCGVQVVESLKHHLGLSSRAAKEQCIDWFNEVKLPRPESIFSSYPHQLSGGQKQRVMLAMAMCCKPEVLIADEPTTALDVTLQKTILELIKSLQQKYGMSVLFITHDLGVISEIADDVLVMFRGKIEEKGSVQEILKSPSRPYTRGLIACRPNPALRLKRLPTVSDFLSAGEDNSVITDILSLNVTSEERLIHHAKLYNAKPLLKVEHLSMSYPGRTSWTGKRLPGHQALRDINLEVYPGETLGLVGESGCGKTTLGRCILRLLDAAQGNIFFRDTELRSLSAKALRGIRPKMQIIFQDPYAALSPRMRIGDALCEPLKVHGVEKTAKARQKKVIALLERVGLDESHLYRYPHEFSGGQRQRICIARALMTNPEFIICDESVSALDVSVQAQVLNLLNELKKDFNFTYIFISHDLSVVKFMSDRMVVMQNGSIVEMGEADKIYRNPEHDYTKKLIAAIPGF